MSLFSFTLKNACKNKPIIRHVEKITRPLYSKPCKTQDANYITLNIQLSTQEYNYALKLLSMTTLTKPVSSILNTNS